eukprot:gene8430-255_t
MFKSVSDSNDIDDSMKKKIKPKIGMEGFELNFQSVFEKEKIKTAFEEYLNGIYNLAPFEFLLLYEKLPDDFEPETTMTFFYIINTFIKNGSMKELNLSGELKKTLFSEISLQEEDEIWILPKTPKETLLSIKKKIYVELYYDSFMNFIKTKGCYDAVLPFSNDETVITKNPWVFVLYKLKNSTYHKESSSEDELRLFAKVLAQSSLLKEDYLSVDDWKIDPKFRNSVQVTEMIKSDLKISQKQLKKFAKIKIVFLQSEKDSTKLKDFFSPILSSFKYSFLGSKFRSALMIGPWLFEWDDCGLCIPRKCVSTAAFLSSDIGAIYQVNSVKPIINTVSEEIEKWNTTKKYSEKENINKEKFGNSQDFVEALLKSINVEYKLPFSIGLFLDRIKREGSTELIFEYSKKFQRTFNLPNDSIKFNTHTQLDEFLKQLNELDSEFEDHWSDEFNLLKSFDRAFWMKYISFELEADRLEKMKFEAKGNDLKIKSILQEIQKIKKEIMRFTPLIHEGDLDCPHGDPIVTHSFFK